MPSLPSAPMPLPAESANEAPPPAPIPAEELEQDPSGTAMLPRFSWLGRTIASAFFRLAEADEASLQGVVDAARQGSLVYVMRTRSNLDYTFFNDFLARHQLPLARFSNGATPTLFAPVPRFLRNTWRQLVGRKRENPVDNGWLGRLLVQGEAALLFLKEPRFWLDSHHESQRDPFEVVIDAQRGRDEPIFLVPQILVWERSPDRSNRGLWDIVFGDHENPGRIRKALHFVLNYRSALVRIGRPVNLQEFLRENEGQPTPRVAKKLRWLLLGYLYRERKVVKGPDVRPRRWLFQRILDEPPVRAAIAEEARSLGRPEAAVLSRAQSVLDKTGADLQWWMIVLLKNMIDLITSKIYSGVEFSEEDAERIRKASRNGVVLLLPCHRSHFDYLLLSWLFFIQGLMPPHIAAGANLSFFPLGPVFRRGGAFFIRRSFAGDPLYATLLSHYIRVLIAEGYTQEFFLEGGRSRTGKMLPPKVGLLGTYVEAMADRLVNDIQMVPVSIAYDLTVEGRSYQAELAGGEKKKESAGELVKSASVLRQRFGRVYVRVNEPISLKDHLAGLGAPYRSLPLDERKAYLKRLAQLVVSEIQDVSVTTPTSLAAMALLTHDRRGITRELVHQRARWFARWLETRTHNFSDSWQFPEDALDEALGMFADAKLVEVLKEEGGPDILAIAADPARRMMLDYYKNQILFHYVPAALFLSALVQEGAAEEPLSALQLRFDFLVDLFREEFIFHPDVPTTRLVEHAGRALQRQRVVATRRPGEPLPEETETPEADPGLMRTADLPPAQLWLDKPGAREADVLVRVTDPEKAALFIATIRNFLESYWVVLEGARALERGPMTEKDFLAALMKTARRMVLTEDLSRPESCSKVNLTNAVHLFQARGVFQVVSEGDEEPRLRVVEEQRDHYVRPVERLFHAGRLGRI